MYIYTVLIIILIQTSWALSKYTSKIDNNRKIQLAYKKNLIKNNLPETEIDTKKKKNG